MPLETNVQVCSRFGCRFIRFYESVNVFSHEMDRSGVLVHYLIHSFDHVVAGNKGMKYILQELMYLYIPHIALSSPCCVLVSSLSVNTNKCCNARGKINGPDAVPSHIRRARCSERQRKQHKELLPP